MPTSSRRVVEIEDVTHHIIERAFRVDPGAQRKIPDAEFRRSAAGHLDIRTEAVECSTVEIDPMIHSMIAVTGMVAAVARQLPIGDQPVLSSASNAAQA